jgi:hypothetical protein
MMRAPVNDRRRPMTGCGQPPKNKLRGLAENNTTVRKIARTLNRSVASTSGAMAAKLGVVLNESLSAI